jgi:hypothetical protein
MATAMTPADYEGRITLSSDAQALSRICRESGLRSAPGEEMSLINA